MKHAFSCLICYLKILTMAQKMIASETEIGKKKKRQKVALPVLSQNAKNISYISDYISSSLHKETKFSVLDD